MINVRVGNKVSYRNVDGYEVLWVGDHASLIAHEHTHGTKIGYDGLRSTESLPDALRRWDLTARQITPRQMAELIVKAPAFYEFLFVANDQIRSGGEFGVLDLVTFNTRPGDVGHREGPSLDRAGRVLAVGDGDVRVVRLSDGGFERWPTGNLRKLFDASEAWCDQIAPELRRIAQAIDNR